MAHNLSTVATGRFPVLCEERLALLCCLLHRLLRCCFLDNLLRCCLLHNLLSDGLLCSSLLLCWCCLLLCRCCSLLSCWCRNCLLGVQLWSWCNTECNVLEALKSCDLGNCFCLDLDCCSGGRVSAGACWTLDLCKLCKTGNIYDFTLCNIGEDYINGPSTNVAAVLLSPSVWSATA